MYIVVEKKTNKVIHINNAPITQNLTNRQVYLKFNDSIHQIGRWYGAGLPKHWYIDSNGYVQEKTLEVLINEKIIERRTGFKAVGNNWIPLTLKEMVDCGDTVIDKTEKIVCFNDKYSIVKMNNEELYKNNVISFDQYKNSEVSKYSKMSFDLRNQLISDYQLTNAAIGIYNESVVESYKKTINAFRDEFYRIKSIIDNATDISQIKAINPLFPNTLL